MYSRNIARRSTASTKATNNLLIFFTFLASGQTLGFSSFLSDVFLPVGTLNPRNSLEFCTISFPSSFISSILSHPRCLPTSSNVGKIFRGSLLEEFFESLSSDCFETVGR